MITRLASLLCTLALLLVPSLALAADDYQPYAPGAAGEQVSAPMFVVIAYSLIWLVLLGFVFSVWRRQRLAEADLDQLRRQLEADGKGGR